MDSTTECATLAQIKPQEEITNSLLEPLFDVLLKIYYRATIHIPRHMPRDLDGFMELKNIMIKYYNIQDRPDVWFTVAGQMSSMPATKIRKPYIHYVNAAKRLDTNSLARDAKLYFNKLNEEMIAKLTENIVASPQASDPEPTPPEAA